MNASHEVFVDSSAWIAVSDRRDRFHEACSDELNSLLKQHRILVTTNLVIAEVHIVNRRTGGHAQAVHFLKSLHGSPRLVRIFSDSNLESRAEEILAGYPDQDFSFTDAVSFALMQEREIQQAFTLDRHFATMNFQLLPAGQKTE